MKAVVSLFVLSFAFFSLYSDVPSDAEHTKALEAGEEAPNPEVTTSEGKTISLKNLMDGKPTLLVFYRGGWCPYCTTQLSDLQKVIPDLKENGWDVIALSPDRPEKIKETLSDYDLDYTLVSDSSLNAAKAFGIAFQVDQPTIEKYKTYKIDLIAASGERHQQLPVPSVFLIDADGKIIYAYSNPDYKVRLSSDELLQALEEPQR